MSKRKLDTTNLDTTNLDTSRNKKSKKSSYSIIIEQNEDGSIKHITHLLNDQKHGPNIHFKDNIISEIINYSYGEKEGKRHIWYKSGLLKCVTTYVKGKKHGLENNYGEWQTKTKEIKYEYGVEIKPQPIKSPTLTIHDCICGC